MVQHLSRFTPILALAMMAAVPARLPAQGGFNGPGRYEISNKQSGKVMDLDRNDQRTVIQFESRGTDNQTWELRSAGGTAYYLINGMNGYALQEVRTNNSAPVEGRPYTGDRSQQWRIEAGRDGTALLISSSGKSLDIPDGTNRNGVKIQVYDRNGDPNQQFLLRQVGNTGGGFFGRRPEGDRRPGGGFFGNSPNNPNPTYNAQPDANGRFWDQRDRIWKVDGDGVCFYRDRDYRGDAYCARTREDRGDVSRDWQGNAFSSVKLFGRARSVDIYTDRNFRGDRARIDRDEPDLQGVGNSYNNVTRRIASLRVN